MDLSSKIEGLLYFKSEPFEISELAKIFKTKEDSINEALNTLEENLKNRGLALMRANDSVTLGTAPELSEMITTIRKEELEKDLSKASIETLSIIIYKNGATRAEIDYIRGVNSSFILRMLSVRGLVEKIIDPNNQRRYIYRPTFDLLGYLGIKSVVDAPDFERLNKELKIEEQNETN